MPKDLDEVAARAAKNEQITSVRIASQGLLDLK